MFFVRLINFRPDLIPYENLTKSTAPENLQTAFDVAERELNIAPLLDASGELAPLLLTIITMYSVLSPFPQNVTIFSVFEIKYKTSSE